MAEQSLKEKTAKGLFWGGLSNGVQQLLNLFFGIFLSRILNAEDYGMVGMLSIFSLIAGSLQESGFTAALANKRDISHKDYNAVFWFSTGLSACLYLILFLCAPLIAEFYHTPELTALARYTFLGFFVASLGIAHSAYLFRNLMVKQKAMAVTIGLTASGTIGITMACLGFAYWGIATQSIVYVGTINICYWCFSPWRPTLTFDFKPLRGMLSFSSKLVVTNIFNHINNNIFTVILGKFYSGQEVGYFTQANKWNYMGHSLISGTVNSVAQPVLSSLSDERERQQRAFRKMLRFTAFISFPAMLGLSLIAPELIILTITDKWLPSAFILQLLCIGGAFIPITICIQPSHQQRKIGYLYVEYHQLRHHPVNNHASALSIRRTYHDYSVCIHQYLLAVCMALFCMETNTAQLVCSAERHPSVCLHSYRSNGGYLLYHYRLCQSVFINGKQNDHSRHTLHSHPVVERLRHF